MGLSHFKPAFPHVFRTLSPKMTPNRGRNLHRWSSGVRLCPPTETRDPRGRKAGSDSPSDWVRSVGSHLLSNPESLRRNTVPKEEKLQEAQLTL